MKLIVLKLWLILIVATFAQGSEMKTNIETNISNKVYQYKINLIDGNELNFEKLKDNVILIVNVASKCGFTNQYNGLQKIHQKYKDNGLIVIGVPSNDFGNQEPGSSSEIMEFCKLNYSVSFPISEKSHVTGGNIIPLYQFLTDKSIHPKTGGKISWNFNKFLIDKNGFVVKRFSSFTKPDSKKIMNEIEKYLEIN